jgi:hypothetical protein
MSEHAYELPPDHSVGALEQLADAAAAGQVIYLVREGARVAAIVSMDVATAGSAAVEALEDASDVAAAQAALTEIDAGAEPIPAERLWAELGL